MKKIILVLTLSALTFFTLISVSFAQEMEPKSIDAVLSEIRVEQGISDTGQIDPNKVSQEKLEELGDAAMEAMIGNTAVHEQMDARLGGEGSESLKAFHINLGLNYLTDYPNGMMNLMTGGMMTGDNSYAARGSNDNNTNTDSGWNLRSMMRNFAAISIAIGFFLLLLIGAIVLIVFLVLRSKKPGAQQEEAIEILRRRYANGEITKEEFDNMLKNIRSL